MIPRTTAEREIFALLGRLRELDARLPQMYLPTFGFSECYQFG
jgi:hypothetical protein